MKAPDDGRNECKDCCTRARNCNCALVSTFELPNFIDMIREWGGVTLAHNVRSPEEVDRLMAEIAAGGGRIVKKPKKADWGGYSGYFADPDGFLWEVAWNPQFPHV